MSLKDLLALSDEKAISKKGLSEERIHAQMSNIREVISFWREYPDLFIDFMKGPDSAFNLFFYQRIFLRIVIRHRYVYAVFPRAYSKSFLAILILMIRCVLFPGSLRERLPYGTDCYALSWHRPAMFFRRSPVSAQDSFLAAIRSLAAPALLQN